MKSARRDADLAAHALVTRHFLSDTRRVLWMKEHAAIRVKLGAEHVQELSYALHSLEALLDVLGVRREVEWEGGQPDSVPPD